MEAIIKILAKYFEPVSVIYVSEKQLDHPVTIEEWERTIERLS